VKIETSGHCLRCDATTQWRSADGWAFHTMTQHWRCSACGCVTQPHLYLPADALKRLHAFEEARRSVVLEVEL